jgi:hypothetical protein
MNRPSAGFSLVLFNKTICKIGGLTDSTSLKFIEFIELYQIDKDKWDILKISLHQPYDPIA